MSRNNNHFNFTADGKKLFQYDNNSLIKVVIMTMIKFKRKNLFHLFFSFCYFHINFFVQKIAFKNSDEFSLILPF